MDFNLLASSAIEPLELGPGSFAISVPKWARLAYCEGIGGGGGGGSGGSGGATIVRSGGGGGGGAAGFRVLIPTETFSGVLTASVGLGGKQPGSGSGAAGVAGGTTSISARGVTLISTAGGAGGAIGGTVAASGGIAGTVSGSGTFFSQMYIHSSLPGTASTTNGAGTSVFPTGTIGIEMRTGGAAGGAASSTGTSNNGGTISGGGWGVSNGVAPGGIGMDGWYFDRVKVSCGGAGGAANSPGLGGSGGNAGNGSGGGGGGGGNTNTPGQGGSGGNGILRIWWIS